MNNEKMGIGDTIVAMMKKQRSAGEKIAPRMNVHVVLRDQAGNIKHEERGENLVTDVGDSVIAGRLHSAAVNIVTGMKLGNSATAAAKNGVGATVVTYITGSQKALDSVATDATKGAGAGWRTTYVCTWAAGVVTNANINEVILTNQTALTDTAGSAAVTLARYIFAAAIDKQAGDSLAVTWQVDILGA